jgi:hypothetical protein
MNEEGNGRPERAPLVVRSRRRNPKTSEIVARELASHIADSELAEGAAVPTERVMAESLGVGRTTVAKRCACSRPGGSSRSARGPAAAPWSGAHGHESQELLEARLRCACLAAGALDAVTKPLVGNVDPHFGEVLVIPGFLGARLHRVAGETPRTATYLAIYELEGDPGDALKEPHRRMKSGPPAAGDVKSLKTSLYARASARASAPVESRRQRQRICSERSMPAGLPLRRRHDPDGLFAAYLHGDET